MAKLDLYFMESFEGDLESRIISILEEYGKEITNYSNSKISYSITTFLSDEGANKINFYLNKVNGNKVLLAFITFKMQFTLKQQ